MERPSSGLFMQQLRLRTVRRSALAFGTLTKRGDKVVKGWLRPVLTDPAIRRDTVRLLRTIAADGPALQQASEGLVDFIPLDQPDALASVLRESGS